MSEKIAATINGVPVPTGNLPSNLLNEVPLLRPRESIFVHYCSLDAFYAIMDSGRFRFTSAKSTNDPSEFFFGQKIVKDVLLNPQASIPASLREHVKNAAASIEERDFRAFVFCMSEAIEDEAYVGELSQWRLYGANGRGVALVIDVANQHRASLLSELLSLPRKIVYGELEGRALAEAVLQDAIRAVEDFDAETKTVGDLAPEMYADHINNYLFWIPSVLKHKAYRHEREVRLIRGDAGRLIPLDFFDRNSIRRPCIELPIARVLENERKSHDSPIRAVVIGPSGDQSAIADSIKFYLEARKWSLDVRRSDIPYRAV